MASHQSPLTNLLNTLQDTHDLLNFESYYAENIKNSKLPYHNSLNEYETGNYQVAYFSNQSSCYERNEMLYYGVSLLYNPNGEDGQPNKFKIKYEELESNVPFSNVIRSAEGHITNFAELEEWVDDNI